METQNLIYLVSCAVNGMKPDVERVASMDLDALFKLARRHMLTATVDPALKVVGVRDERFAKALEHSALKGSTMDMEMDAVFAELDGAEIWHMPLKGIVLQHLYPAYGMRQMSDHDVLFDHSRADDVKRIMESLGFTTVSFNRGVHDTYHKEPVSNFEMHRVLFGAAHDERIEAYYRDVEARLIHGSGCSRRFTPEDFYIYMIAHEYKHYSGGGTGLRSLLDTYVYIKHCGKNLDWDYIKREVEKLGITVFERQNRNLALHLFSEEGAVDCDMSAADKEMLSYIISSGTYGTVEHSVENAVKKAGSKNRYLWNRLFLPMETVQTAYPFFYKHKTLLPALFLFRVGRCLTVSWKRTKRELKILFPSQNPP